MGPENERRQGTYYAAPYPGEVTRTQEHRSFRYLLDRLETQVSNAQTQLSLATEIRSRIAGQMPEPEHPRGIIGTSPSPNGLVEELGMLIDRLGETLEKLHSEQQVTHSHLT